MVSHSSFLLHSCHHSPSFRGLSGFLSAHWTQQMKAAPSPNALCKGIRGEHGRGSPRSALAPEFYKNPSSQILKKASPPGSGATSVLLRSRPQPSSQVDTGTGTGARSPVMPTSTPPFHPFTCLPIVLSDRGREPQRSEVHSPPQQSTCFEN